MCYPKRDSIQKTTKWWRKMIGVGMVGSLLICSGCASIVSDSQYPVTINSTPSEATVTVKDQDGVEVYRGKTPATTVLKAGAGFFKSAKYTISCEKDDYMPSETTLSADVDGWYFGNLLFGGLIGMLAVDPATGAMWKLDNSVNVTLSEK